MSTSSRTVNVTTFRAELRRLYDVVERAALDGDLDAYLTPIAKDVVFDVHGTTGVGIDALRKTFPADFKAELSIRSLETFLEGDTGWDWVQMEAKGETAVMRLLYQYAHRGGRWQCVRLSYIEATAHQALLQ